MSVQSAMVPSQKTDTIEYMWKEGPQMHPKMNCQINLFNTVSNNPIAWESEEISNIIDANPSVLDLVYQL